MGRWVFAVSSHTASLVSKPGLLQEVRTTPITLSLGRELTGQLLLNTWTPSLSLY